VAKSTPNYGKKHTELWQKAHRTMAKSTPFYYGAIEIMP
jgi:hypothetical protein